MDMNQAPATLFEASRIYEAGRIDQLHADINHLERLDAREPRPRRKTSIHDLRKKTVIRDLKGVSPLPTKEVPATIGFGTLVLSMITVISTFFSSIGIYAVIAGLI